SVSFLSQRVRYLTLERSNPMRGLRKIVDAEKAAAHADWPGGRGHVEGEVPLDLFQQVERVEALAVELVDESNDRHVAQAIPRSACGWDLALRQGGSPRIRGHRREPAPRPAAISEADARIAAIAKSRGAAPATRNVDDFAGCRVELINPWV